MNKSILATLVAAALPSWYGAASSYLTNYQHRKRHYSKVDLGSQELPSSVELSADTITPLNRNVPDNNHEKSSTASRFKISDLELTGGDHEHKILSTVVGQDDKSEYLPEGQLIELDLKQGKQFSELVVIDEAVPQQSLFLNSLSPKVAVHKISSHEDGLTALLEILSDYQDLETIRIVSHAESGALLLGKSRIDANQINQHLNDFAKVNGAIKAGGDLLLYGCDLAKGEKGEEFLTLLSNSTGWDIAASDDSTGAISQGGDWELEVVVGDIESHLPDEYIYLADFDHILGLSGGAGTIDMSGFATGYAATKSYATDGSTIQLSADAGTGNDVYCFGAGAGRRCYFDTPQSVNITKAYVDFTGGDTFDVTSLYIYNQDGAARTFTITSDQSDSHTTGSISSGAGTTVSLTGFTGITKLTIAYSDGSNMDAVGIDDIVLANVTSNTTPTVSGVPSTLTITEDTTSNIDLSSANFNEDDAENITVTLTAGSGTFSTPADGAGVGSGVTENLASSTVITLVGTDDDIDTYLDTASNIQYTPASNVNGSAAATITISGQDTDGPASFTTQTVTIDITAQNDAPTVSSLPSTLTFTEDTQGNVALGAGVFADVDGDNITATITASAGTFATPADGAGIGGGVTETLASSTVITLVGAPADINSYLDTASNIQYTPAFNVNGAAAATLVITGQDTSAASLSPASNTVTVDVTADNDVPTAASVPSSATVVEDQASDIDLSAVDFADVESDDITYSIVAASGTLAASDGNGTTDSVTISGSGTATLTLVGSEANLESFLNTTSRINFTTASNATSAVNLVLTPNDAGAGTASTLTLSVTAVNDEPTLSIDGGNQSVGGDGVGGVQQTVSSFASMSDDGDAESTQAILDFTVSEDSDANNVVSGVDIDNNGTLVFTPSDGVAGSAVINVQVQDDGGTANSGDDTSQTGQFTITVDTQDPTISEATAVDSITSDTTPNIVINSNETGDITLTGSCGVHTSNASLSVGNNTFAIQASDNTSVLNEGTYSDCGAYLVDDAGNTGNTITLTSFEVDTTSPTIIEVTPVSSPTSDSTPDVVISLSEGGTLAVGGSCGSASEGAVSSGTITIALTDTDNSSALASGAYNDCELSMTDAAGNVSSAITLNAFSIDTSAPTLASSAPFDNATSVVIGNNIVLTFSEDVSFSSGTIAIIDVDASTVVESFSSGDVTVSGANVTINPTSNLGAGSNYAVQIGSDALTDTAGNAYAGISNNTTLNFTTRPNVVLSVDSSTIAEDGGTATITAALQNEGGSAFTTADEVVLNLNLTGTATRNTDYSLAGTGFDPNDGSLTFLTIGISASSNTIVVTATDDVTSDTGETLAFDLDSATNATEASAQSVTITINENALPTLTSLDGASTFTEDGSSVVIDSNVTISDAELDALNSGSGNYTGATLTIARSGGANSEDTLSVQSGSQMAVSGTDITNTVGDKFAGFTSGSGSLTVSFSGDVTIPTTALVNEVLQNITFSNGSDNPDASVSLVWTFNDTVTDTSETATVYISPINDAPTVASVPATLGVTEDVQGILSLSNVVMNDPEDDAVTLSLSVSEGTFGNPIDGSGVGAGVVETFNGGGLITLVGSATDINTYLDNASAISYTTASNSNTTATLTLTPRDAGDTGTAATTTLAVTAVNDVPSDISLSGTTVSDADSSGTTVGTLTSVDVDSSSFTYSLVSTGTSTAGACGVDTDNGNFSISGDTLQTANSFTAGNSQTICIQTSDGALTYQEAFVITVSDGTAPSLSSSSPSDNSVSVAVGSNVVLVFDDDIAFGSGTISLINTSDSNSTVETYVSGGGSNSGSASISGTTLTLNPGSDLLAGNSYAVQIDANAITDDSSNGFAGITNNTTLNFTTQPQVVISVDESEISEPATESAVVTVALQDDSGSAFTAVDDVEVEFTLSGTATNSSDYSVTGLSGPNDNTLTISTGNNSSSFTVTAIDDGAGDDGETVIVDVVSVNNGTESATQTETITIGENSAPTISSLPSIATITEDTESTLDLSATEFADGEGDSLEVILRVSSGKITSPLGNSGSVNVNSPVSTQLTLIGTPTNLNSYLDNANAVAVTSDENATDNITLTAMPNDGSVDGNTATMILAVDPVNDHPTSNYVSNGTFEFDGGTISGAIYSEEVDGTTLTVQGSTADWSLTTLTSGNFDGSNISSVTSVTSSIIFTISDPVDIDSFVFENDDSNAASSGTFTFAVLGTENNEPIPTDTTSSTLGLIDVNDWNSVTGYLITHSNGTMGPLLDDISFSKAASLADITFTEDTAGNLDLSLLEVSDVDSSTITLLLSVDDGTFSPPVSPMTGNLAANLDGNVISLVGTPSEINSYLDTPTFISYTPSTDTNGDNAATLTTSANDGDGSGDVALTTISIDISAVNDAPEISNFNSDSLSYTEDDTAMAIDQNGDATVTDVDNTDFNGGTLTATISNNQVSTEDILTFTDTDVTLSGTTSGSDITIDGVVIGTLGSAITEGNTLTAVLNEEATVARVQTLVRSIAYQNSNTSTPAESTRSVSVTLNDGADTSTGVTASVVVGAENDAPTIGGTPPTNALEDVAYSFTPTASDPENDTLTFSITNQPSWANFNSSSGALSGTPANNDVGNYNGIVISVSDGTTSASLPSFNIEVINVNDAPTIGGTPPTTIAEDSQYSFTPSAEDVDGDQLNFSATGLPDWASFNQNTGRISGTPRNDDVGTHSNIVISVSDGEATASLPAFSITVTNTNDAPSITGVPSGSATQDELYSFIPNASDQDGDALTFSVSNLPSWASFDQATGEISGTPTNDDVGNYTGIVISVSDGTASSSLPSFDITVSNVNDAPEIAGNPGTSVDGGSNYSFTPTASDPDNDELTFSVENLPDWAEFDSATGTLSGSPGNSDAGVYSNIVITVSDGELNASLAPFSIEVISVNNAPAISDVTLVTPEDTELTATLEGQDEDNNDLTFTLVSEPEQGNAVINGSELSYIPAENDVGTYSFTYKANDGIDDSNIATITVEVTAVNDAPVIEGDALTSVKVGTGYSFTPAASDIENDELTFTISNLPRWATFDSATGTISGEPTNSDVGTYGDITIVVSDGDKEATLTPFNIEVIANEAPVISGAPLTLAPVGEAYSFVPTATDVDDETLSFSIENQPGWATFDSETGALSGTPADTDVGATTGIVISVTDGFSSVSLPAFSIEVCETCEDVPPVISGTPDTTVVEGSSYSFTPEAADANDDELTFSISNQPSWAQFDSATGTLSGTPTDTDVGTTTGIVISVSDGNTTVSLPAFAIEVLELNEAPTISGTPNTSVFQNEEYRFSPTASDPDEDGLVFSIENQPAWASFNPTTGTLRGRPNGDNVGTTSNIVISVTDNINAPVSLPAFNLEVLARNTAPEISGNPRTAITQGKEYRFTPTASDTDGDDLTFSIENMPDWGSFTATTGALTGIPTADDVGTFDGIVISVSDGQDTASLAPFSINVTAANNAPSASDSTVTVAEDSDVDIIAEVSDPDGDELEFTVISGPANGALLSIPNGWRYEPNPDFTGTDSFVFTASDGEFESDSATVNVTVTSVNDVPEAVDDSFTVDQLPSAIYTLDVLANDTDPDIATAGDSLTLQGASANLGSVSIVDNQLQYTPGNSFLGRVRLSYSVRDNARAQDRANVSLTINGVSGVNAPSIVVPDDVTVDATGLFTKVDLGVATATDADGNPLPVSLVDGDTTFPPGSHTVFWQTEDRFGTTSTESQEVNVNPRISLSKDKKVSEGSRSRVRVILNGDAPSYPITVPYTVTGTAQGDSIDHNAESGAVTFEQGREQVIHFDIFNDSEIEVEESIIFTLDEGQNRGANRRSVITISEQNIAPEIALRVFQNGNRRRTVAQDEGQVTIQATVTDANPQDSLNTEWTASGISNVSDEELTFAFDPSTVAVGVYEFTLFASDDGDPILSSTNTAVIDVVDSLTVLSDDTDSDGDLIPDSQEGFADSDGDGIPDYLDAIADCNVVPEQASTQDGFLVESDPGVCLRQGTSSAQNESDGLQVLLDSEDRRARNVEGDMLIAQNVPEDKSAANIGGLFDFVLYDLPEEGQSVSIVIPQVEPVPSNAVYRKYRQSSNEWVDFVTNDNNGVFSATGEQGVCPPPGDAAWQPGLSEGDWCVQLLIQDGGPNDDDGLANGAIVDPGGVAVVLDNNQLPVAVNDSAVMQWNTSIEILVLENDSDPDGDALSVVNASAAFGTVVINDALSLTYTPNAGFVGKDNIVYAVSDGNNGTDSASVTVTINGNRAPGAVDDAASTDDLTAIEIDVLTNDIDVDGDTITLQSAEAENGSAVVTGNNTILYTPTENFDGVDIITYVIADAFGETDTGTVSVTVDGNQAPVAADDVVTTGYNSSVTINVLANDSDVDGDTLTVTDIFVDKGTAVVNADNTITYTPPTNFSGTDVIVYTISDGILTSEAAVNITVQPEPVETITVTNKSSGGGSMFWLILGSIWLGLQRRIRQVSNKKDVE
ncbi:MAG: tandem-95 repeat protein [Aestuariibacter sp.]